MAYVLNTNILKPGDIFLAFRGQKTHGIYFIPQALQRGASGLVLQKEDQHLYGELYGKEDFFQRFPVVFVEDMPQWLLEKARQKRHHSSAMILGITGSVGKTTIKEGIAHILQQDRTHKVFSTFGNHNNKLGLSLGMMNMPEETTRGVFEMGINGYDEMEHLVDIVRPNIALVTNISNQHCGNFRHVQDIAQEKGKIFHGATQGILWADDPYAAYLREVAEKNNGPKEWITFGTQEKSHGCLKEYTPPKDSKENFGSLRATFFGHDWTYRIPHFGYHWALNSVLLTTLALTMGISKENILEGHRTFFPPRGRGNKIAGPGGLVIWDHTYNGAQRAFEEALKHFSQEEGSKFLILGDMAELGEETQSTHKALVPFINNTKAEGIFLIGPSMMDLEPLLKIPVMAKGESWEDIKNALRNSCKGPCHCFFKGSRGMKLDKCVDFLLSLSCEIH